MTYTGEQIKAAIDAWAEAQVDKYIADRIEYNKGRIAESEGNRYFNKSYYPTEVDQFNRESVHNSIAESFYEVYGDTTVTLPDLGEVKLVDSYGGEGQGDEWWRVFEIGGEFYKADHYYSSYETEPWHTDCTIFPVIGREKVVTEWVAQ